MIFPHRFFTGLMMLTAVMLPAASASAFFHLWKFTEFFSSADGAVQFIELKSSGPGETQATGAELSSVSTGKKITLSPDLVGSTQDMHLLLATPGFASYVGGIAPNFILPAGFFNPAGDTIRLYHHQPIDEQTFTSVPTDGINSRHYPSNATNTNSPTNFAGQIGAVSYLAGDYNDNNVVDAADYTVWREKLWGVDFVPNDTTPFWTMDDDYTVWRENFGKTISLPGSTASFTLVVPEPAAGIAFLATTALLPVSRLRRPR